MGRPAYLNATKGDFVCGGSFTRPSKFFESGLPWPGNSMLFRQVYEYPVHAGQPRIHGIISVNSSPMGLGDPHGGARTRRAHFACTQRTERKYRCAAKEIDARVYEYPVHAGQPRIHGIISVNSSPMGLGDPHGGMLNGVLFF